MRVLLFSSSYPPVLGGLQTVAHQLAKGLIQEEHTVQVVTNRYPRSLPQKEIIEGVNVNRFLFLNPSLKFLKQGRLDLFLASLFYYPFTLYCLVKLFRDFSPQVVNFHFPDAQTPYVLWLQKWFSFRLVVSLHGDEVERLFLSEQTGVLGKHRQQLARVLHEADAVTACSGALLEKAKRVAPQLAKKAHVIHNGINPSRFQNQDAHQHPRPYIFAYGRLTYIKGFDLLLSAFAKISGENPNMDLILAGDGTEEGDLRKQAKDLELNSRVRFWGRATSEEVVHLLNGCQFLVIPSRKESFGIVAVEGMAAGKPILATRVGGLAEIFENNDYPSLLVEPSTDALTQGLRYWLSHSVKEKKMQEAREWAWLNFSWGRVVSYYGQVLGGNC